MLEDNNVVCFITAGHQVTVIKTQGDSSTGSKMWTGGNTNRGELSEWMELVNE